MLQSLWHKIKESAVSVLPVTAIVMLLLITIAPVGAPILLSFILGAVLQKAMNNNAIEKNPVSTGHICELVNFMLSYTSI